MANSDVRRVIPVVLAGGSGTRLWPLSREALPKQFLPLVAKESLYQQTLLRARDVLGAHAQPPIVIANARHRELVLEQCRATGLEPHAVLLEPAGRNTAPAIAIAALLARGAAPEADPLLLVLPADHVIAEPAAFAAAVETAIVAAAEGRLVTFGIVPDRPETGYGYIQKGRAHGSWSEVQRFVEKPELAAAERFVRSGEYLWNSGMFLFSASRFLEELAAHAGDVLAACQRAAAETAVRRGAVELGESFLASPAISIDYAVMERTPRGAVVPMSAGWSDVGSWSALHDIVARDDRGNGASGNVVMEECANTYVAAQNRLVVAIGLDDVVIVESNDAVLVVRRDRAQDVKRIVDRLKSEGRGPR
jgi:mannose-1-phosphate guanylyltransferase/mannose-6-phosphate isomerase